jgi:hypothetical protein
VKRLYSEPRFTTPYSVDDPGNPPEPYHWQVPQEQEEVLCPA